MNRRDCLASAGLFMTGGVGLSHMDLTTSAPEDVSIQDSRLETSDGASATVDATVENARDSPISFRLAVTFLGTDGDTVGETTMPFDIGGSGVREVAVPYYGSHANAGMVGGEVEDVADYEIQVLDAEQGND